MVYHNAKNLNKKGQPPIFHCKDKFSFKEMLRLGANINHQDNEGKSLIFYYQQEDVIKEILNSDINFSIKDNNGRNFLSYSLFSHYPDLIMEYRNKFDFNSVILSEVFTNSAYLCGKLIEQGFDITLENDISLGYPPERNKTELKKLIKILLDISDIDNKDIRFYFTPYYVQPVRKFFTLRNLYNISSKG
ncbi:hypothetical protein [Brenneria tiliae]|uniref:Ankyrin repeat domain-containing protein n=1 Tax=Brenneria tiliae TaxID=2914984 RepID=A0ABT0MVI5_9GAMM|nr:hypothetical protein [Brenneria tiliae]MCL2893209.1 hypothetical protein [Brenneria tiliae]